MAREACIRKIPFRLTAKTARGDSWFNLREPTLKQHFTWKNVVSRAASIMFFGSPLSMTQSFDSIFKGVNATTARERFLQYYEQFENNTNACLCVYNSYLARRLAISEENTRKAKKKHPKKNRSIAEFL